VARWRYALPRERYEQRYEQVGRAKRFGYRIKVARDAEAAGAVLRSDEPVAGWVSNQISRDRKDWPCGEGARGARPAWIWTGDVR
jgi:hypothetical protein